MFKFFPACYVSFLVGEHLNYIFRMGFTKRGYDLGTEVARQAALHAVNHEHVFAVPEHPAYHFRNNINVFIFRQMPL